MTRLTVLFIVCGFAVALLLFVVARSEQAEDFKANFGYTLGNVGSNRLCNFIKKKSNPKALRKGYGTTVSLHISEQQRDNRGLRRGTKWGDAWAYKE